MAARANDIVAETAAAVFEDTDSDYSNSSNEANDDFEFVDKQQEVTHVTDSGMSRTGNAQLQQGHQGHPEQQEQRLEQHEQRQEQQEHQEHQEQARGPQDQSGNDVYAKQEEARHITDKSRDIKEEVKHNTAQKQFTDRDTIEDEQNGPKDAHGNNETNNSSTGKPNDLISTATASEKATVDFSSSRASPTQNILESTSAGKNISRDVPSKGSDSSSTGKDSVLKDSEDVEPLHKMRGDNFADKRPPNRDLLHRKDLAASNDQNPSLGSTKNLHKIVTDQKDEINKLKHENSVLSEKSEHASLRVEQFEALIRKMSEETERAKDNLKLVSTRAEQRVEQLKERTRRLEDDLTTAKRAREASVAAYAELQTKYRDILRGLDDKERSHQATVGATGAEIEKLQARLTEMGGYQQEVHSLRADIAALKADLSLKSQDAQQAQEEAKSLRGLLQQFALEKEEALALSDRKVQEARKHADSLVAAARSECRKEIAILEEKAAKANALVSGLQEAANASASDAAKALEDRDRARRERDRAETRLRETEDDEMVDRRLVCKLLLTYIQRGADEEILDLMSVILNFTKEQRLAVGARTVESVKQENAIQQGGVGGMINFVSALTGIESSQVKQEDVEGKTFAEVWNKYLLAEDENEGQ